MWIKHAPGHESRNLAYIFSCISVDLKEIGTDHEADLEVCEKDERDDEDADHGEGQVPPQLEHDHLVRLPRRVDLKEEQGEWRGEREGAAWLADWLIGGPRTLDKYSVETGYKVVICPRGNLLYMQIYLITGQKLL